MTSAPRDQDLTDCDAEFHVGAYRAARGRCAATPLRYRLLRPAVAPIHRVPLLLFLHGAGERGDDNRAQLRYLPQWLSQPPLRARHPCVVVAPQVPLERIWSTVHWTAGRRRYGAAPTDELAAAYSLLVQILEDDPSVDPQRVYLTGISMGGYGAWEMAARWPERFAAVVPVCGGGDVEQAARLVGLPLWAFHGAEDEVVPPVRSREMIAALVAAGGQPRYSELPGVGHDAWTPVYTGPDSVLPWLFSQRSSGSAPRSRPANPSVR